MPRFLHPTQSGVHRLACLSLYHALLSQCSKAWLTRSKASDIRDIIQARFRLDKPVESPSRIEKSLRAGYEALALLKSCAEGNATSIERADSLVAGALPFIEKYKEKCARLARRRQEMELEEAKRKKENRTFSAQAVLESVLRRPYPKVSGVRQVPRFVAARDVPFLRIKKPQPERLSLAIRIKLDARWKNMLRKKRLETEGYFARDEDAWDRLTLGKEPFSWEKVVNENIALAAKAIQESDAQHLELAHKMWNVVLAEEALAKKEAEERERQSQIVEPEPHLEKTEKEP
ncbi:hypothetical protein FQN49_000459 [Arthroderma sp. PD_2]|nr:hypothetical protein FQN49_000459 [Arthroderma sp. PD_2]